MASTINFFSLNVGMSSALAGLPALISSLYLDIIYLQEVKISSEQLKLHVGNWVLMVK